MSRSPRIFQPLLVAGLLATLSLAGCKRDAEVENKQEREANAKKVTADSTHDATEPVVDEDYRFRLALPGPGWKLLREHDASSIHPDAIAGALQTGAGAYGVVIIERLPGTTLEQAKELVWDDSLPELVVESEVDLEFQGLPAKRRTFTANIDGVFFRYVSTIFMRQGYLHQLMSWSSNKGSVEVLLPFHESFGLLEGEVTARDSIRAPVVEADGVGWRIREGRYESALSELRVRPAEGWRFVIGTELELLGSDAEIVLMRETTNAYVALIVERVAKDKGEALAGLTHRLFEEGQEAPAIEISSRDIAGRSVELRRYGAAPLEFLHGVYVGDEAITQLQVWYPLGLSEDVGGSLDPLFAGFEQIPARERAELRQELLGAPASQRRFTAGRAYRAGELLDYEHRVGWTRPPGFWQVDSFARALDHSAQTVLMASELDLGIYAALEVFESGSQAADTLTELVGDDELLSRDTVVVDGLTIHQARTIDHSRSPPMSYEFAITRRGDSMIGMTAWAADETPAHRQAMAAALAGVHYEQDLEQTTIAGGVFTDVIHGFSFEIPAGFDRPEVTALGLGQIAAWTKGEQELVSVVITDANTDDEQWTSSFFEQILRDRVGDIHPLGTPERSEAKLGIYTTRHLSWDQGRKSFAADIVVRDSLVYCFLYVNLSDAQIETVQSSWELLE